MRLTGRRPSGYRAPAYAFSGNTLELLQEQGFLYDSSLFGADIPYLIGNRSGQLPTDLLSLDDWTQYVCLPEFGYMLPIAAPARAMEVFRAEFDAAWRHGGLWTAVWHPFVSGRLARCDAIALEYMLEKGGVWLAPLHDIAAHVRHLIESGTWTPRRDTIPFWPAPMDEDPSRMMAKQPLVLNVSHYMPPDHGTHVDFIAPWAKAVEAATEGGVSVIVPVSGSSPLGRLEDQYAQVTSGIVDVARFAGRAPAWPLPSRRFSSICPSWSPVPIKARACCGVCFNRIWPTNMPACMFLRCTLKAGACSIRAIASSRGSEKIWRE